MYHLPLSTVPTRKFRIPPMTRWTTLCPSMRQQRSLTNFLSTHTPSFTTFNPRDCAFSQYTDLQDDRTWHTLASQTSYSRGKLFRSSTTATASATLPMWMISVEGVKRVMQHAPEKVTGEDGLPLPPYAVYNIGNSNPENLLDFVTILQE